MKGHHGLKDYGSDIAHGSIAQMFALVAGVILTVAGIAALVVNFVGPAAYFAFGRR